MGKSFHSKIPEYDLRMQNNLLILDGQYFVYFVNLCVPNIDIESLLVMNIHEASDSGILLILFHVY